MDIWNTIQHYFEILTGDTSSYSIIFAKGLMAIVFATLLWFLLKLLLAFLHRKSRNIDILQDSAIIFQSLSRAITILLLFATCIYIFQTLSVISEMVSIRFLAFLIHTRTCRSTDDSPNNLTTTFGFGSLAIHSMELAISRMIFLALGRSAS